MIHFWCEFGENGLMHSIIINDFEVASMSTSVMYGTTPHERCIRVQLSVKVLKNHLAEKVYALRAHNRETTK